MFLKIWNNHKSNSQNYFIRNLPIFGQKVKWYLYIPEIWVMSYFGYAETSVLWKICWQKKNNIQLSDTALLTFEMTKRDLINAVYLSYPDLNDFCPAVGACVFELWAVPQQCTVTDLFSFQRNYLMQKWNTAYSQLLSIYAVINHFCHFLEWHIIQTLTDHKPLIRTYR